MSLPRPFVLAALLAVAACSAEQSPAGPAARTDPPDTTVPSTQVIASGPLPLPFSIPASTGVNSAAMGIWVPDSLDSCSPAIHDAYRTVGPDGKWYPTWHPPIDPIT